MQHLNNDMDELMRKAAGQYPLKPAGMDWEKVAAQLQTPVTPASPKNKGGKYFLFLFSFLLLSLVCDKYYIESQKENGLSGRRIENGSEKVIPQKEEQSSNKGSAGTQKKDRSFISLSSDDILDKRLVSVRKQREQPPIVVLVINKGSTQKITTSPSAAAPLQTEKNESSITKIKEPDTGTDPSVMEALTSIEVPEKKTEEVPVQNEETVNEKSTEQKSNTHWYVSLLLGPDVSTVKMQKTEGVGYSVGALAGYQIAKRWSVETGLFWDRKNYYSVGTYFKPDKLYLPAHSKILHAEGYCNMFEWPLNVRYQFIQGNKSTWYALAGVSSYLMQKEEYNYLYERYNMQYYKTKYYTRSSKDWFAALNLSLGYEHKLGHIGTLRIEPYTKLPLKGVGVGRLPLTSAGLYVGITYPLQ